MIAFTKEQLSEVMCKHAEKENGQKKPSSCFWGLIVQFGENFTISSCFFSSRENMRIPLMSVRRRRCSTSFPKLPVSPEMSSISSLTIGLIY